MNRNIALAILMFALGMIIVFIIKWVFLDREERKEKEEQKKKKEEPKNPLEILKDDHENSLKKVLEAFHKEENKLLIPLGFDEENNLQTINLKETPNSLVIGTTGGGKSICLNEMIASIAINYTPEELKLITFDTSIVELSSFNGIPHYLKPTISNPEEIKKELDLIQKEAEKPHPPVLIIMDDFYDICKYDKSVITLLQGLFEKENLYFIFATDTPSKDILTKAIKEKIQGTFYLTMAPGEKEDFDIGEDLTPEEQDYLTKIGNLVFETNHHKIKIQVPEILDEEIKAIKNDLM